MSATGYIQVRVYESYALIPLQNAAITVTSPDGTAIAMRLTDRNGLIPMIEIPVPDKDAGLQPDTGVIPYTAVNMYARKEGYEQLENENLQVFPDIITDQNLEMIPLSELPANWSQIGVFQTPPQNL